MDNNKDELTRLAAKILDGKASDSDIARYNRWFAAHQSGEHAPIPQLAETKAVLYRRIQAAIPAKRPAPVWHFRPSYWAAAAVLVFALAGIYFYLSTGNGRYMAVQDAGPGGNRATLLLADGRTIDLSTNQEGIVVGDDGIRYNNGDSLVGHWLRTEDNEGHPGSAGPESASNQMEYNTLATPHGGQYRITLSDGSKVWLNAGSRLRYPVRFGKEERVVELEGEAYFEVSGQVHGTTGTPKVPFLVETTAQTVEVLGTRFNISAYPDEAETKTTLVEGSVAIRPGDGERLQLSPGEQGVLAGTQLTKHEVDVSNYIAWTKGYFKFSGDLESILKQLGRWYDAAVVYRDDSVKAQRIFGIVYRDMTLREALKIISLACEAHFRVEERQSQTTGKTERRIIVMMQ